MLAPFWDSNLYQASRGPWEALKSWPWGAGGGEGRDSLPQTLQPASAPPVPRRTFRSPHLENASGVHSLCRQLLPTPSQSPSLRRSMGTPPISCPEGLWRGANAQAERPPVSRGIFRAGLGEATTRPPAGWTAGCWEGPGSSVLPQLPCLSRPQAPCAATPLQLPGAVLLPFGSW